MESSHNNSIMLYAWSPLDYTMATTRRTGMAWRKKTVYIVMGFILLQAAIPMIFSVTMLERDFRDNTAFSLSSPSTQLLLSNKQSNGFFDDIMDGSWRIMQQRARSSDQYEFPSEPETEPKMWYLNNLQPDFTCPHMARIGRRGDGPKWVCDPHRLLKRPDCLIYSVGSEGNYEWEDGLVKLLGNNNHFCEIHVFGPGDYARPGDQALLNIHYHQWGIKSSYDQAYNDHSIDSAARGNEPKMYTFQEIVEELGHKDRKIDILKINCEKCEWASYQDWISMDIQQILIESHGVPSPVGGNDWHGSPMHAADFFNAFRSNHFAMFSKEVNVRGGGTSVEFGYVKLHPDFWEDTLKAAALEQIAIPSIVVPDAPPAPYRIPRRLIFIYETDLLNTENPVELFFNAKHIIDKYRGAWNESYAPVWFLDEPSCLAAIYQARVELIYFYRIEKNKQRKSDICRVAALYLSGGYYFDVNLEMGSLYEPDDDVSVAVAREGDRFSNMFLASEQKGSVVKAALDNMVAFYKRNDTRPDVRLGSETLAEAIRELNATVKVDILPLKEIVKYPPTPWIVAEMPVHSFDNPVPLEMSGPPSPGHKIPRRLIFTYKSNLLETKDPPLFYENVQKTIKMYREAWGEPKAPVWFLNDMDCRSAIYAAKPNLLVYFDREVHGSWKADICRVAALYLTGGYYFDVDMEAVDPWIPDRNVTFATALQPDKTRYFQSFLASERRGGILEVALDEMLLFYETKMIRTGKLLGPDTLKIAFNSVAISERGSTMFLEEVQFPEDEAAGLRDNGVGCCCNFGVQDPATNTRKFFSRVVGGSSGCLDRDSPEGQAYLKLAEAAAVDATRDASGRRD